MAGKSLSPADRPRRRRYRWTLTAVALIGLGTAWWLYPKANGFSMLSCTISFLGSPDADRNPNGWRFYQAGMTALLLLLVSLTAERHTLLRPRIGNAAMLSSGAIGISLTLLMLATWIPDSREQWLGFRLGEVHTRLALLAIPAMGFGLALDGLALWWSGARCGKLWPFPLYGAIVLTGTGMLMRWERLCRRDPSLPHWPGPGLYSTPLWEWIVFVCLIGFMAWLPRALAAMDRKEPAPIAGRDQRPDG